MADSRFHATDRDGYSHLDRAMNPRPGDEPPKPRLDAADTADLVNELLRRGWVPIKRTRNRREQFLLRAPTEGA